MAHGDRKQFLHITALAIVLIDCLLMFGCGGVSRPVGEISEVSVRSETSVPVRGSKTARGQSTTLATTQASASPSAQGSTPPIAGAAIPVVAPTTASTAATASVAAASSSLPVVSPPQYEMLPDELINNPQFAAGLAQWSVNDATLVPSESRAGANALRVSGDAKQAIAPGKLEPGKSYTLTVKARNLGSAGAVLAVRFRKPQYSESYRTYKSNVASSAWQEYQVDFTVPAYTAMAEVSIVANGSPVLIDSASLKMRSALVHTQPVASSSGSYVPSGYALAFNDEFNGPALDTRKWFTRYIYESEHLDRLNDELQRYRDNNNHQFANGVLSLVAREVSTDDRWGINYESGMLRSDWTTRYGYFEARVRMPGGKGVWPAFWLSSDVAADGSLVWPPEIDIFEFVNNGQDDKANMLHTGVIAAPGSTSAFEFTDADFNQTWTYWSAPYNFNDGWHTIGAEWTPQGVTTYVDGKKIVTRVYPWKYPNGAEAGPAHILLNLAIGGSWAGRYGVDRAAFPQALQIDWVRAYKKIN
jgi:beta-glucanase (GH16 family)